MDFVKHPQHTRFLHAPRDWDQSQGRCEALSVHDGQFGGYPSMKSRWEPTKIEAITFALGAAQIELGVISNSHPPVSMAAMPVAGWTADREKMAQAYADTVAELSEHAKANGFELVCAQHPNGQMSIGVRDTR